ncbi:MAG TPA: helix-turn-helix domain-containing protein [Terracidiphilus sp.]
MSHKNRKRKAAKRESRALVFAALGDETRLGLVAALSSGEPASISQLSAGSRLTRQAVTKHLRVLERAGIVRNLHVGRESLFAFDPRPLSELHDYLDRMSRRWDDALARLKSFVEEEARTDKSQ